MSYLEEFKFKLSKPIKFHNEGTEDICKELILKAPCAKHRRQTTEMKQSFFRAVKSMSSDTSSSSENAKNENHNISSEEIVTCMLMSNVDMNAFCENFKELLLNDICWLTNKQHMTNPIYENLSDVDLEAMMGEYMANFLLSLWTKALRVK